MLKIWGRTNSINVQKVLWCCGEIGLRYERIDAGLAFGVNNTPEYKAMVELLREARSKAGLTQVEEVQIGRRTAVGRVERVRGMERLKEVVLIDQSLPDDAHQRRCEAVGIDVQ